MLAIVDSRQDSDVSLRPARADEAAELSLVAARSKAHWGYSPRQIELWREALTVTAESILSSPTFVAEVRGRVVGFCQVSVESLPADVEHLWVAPEFLHRGIGRRLLGCALDHLVSLGFQSVEIEADPNAEGFYAGLGARRIGSIPAPIEGDAGRRRPRLRLRIGAGDPPRNK